MGAAPWVVVVGWSLAACDVTLGVHHLGPPPPDAPLVCPADYTITLGGASKYKFNSAAKVWAIAELDCDSDTVPGSALSTHLVVVGAPDEDAALRAQDLVDFWTGLTDRRTANEFLWITAEDTRSFPPPTGDPWAPGQPNNGGDSCVAVEQTSAVDPVAGWYDRSCDSRAFAYYCECDAFPSDVQRF